MKKDVAALAGVLDFALLCRAAARFRCRLLFLEHFAISASRFLRS